MDLYFAFFCLITLLILVFVFIPFGKYNRNYIKSKMPYEKSLQRLKQEKNIGIISLFFILCILIYFICSSKEPMVLYLLLIPISTLFRSILLYIFIKRYIKKYMQEEETPEAKEEKSEHRI